MKTGVAPSLSIASRERVSAQSRATISRAPYGFRATIRSTWGPCPRSWMRASEVDEDRCRGALQRHRRAHRRIASICAVNYTVDRGAHIRSRRRCGVQGLASGSSDVVWPAAPTCTTAFTITDVRECSRALRSGQCRPFDARRMLALGEGVAVVVLKRLADAERDGIRVYAVIKGVGGSSDGKAWVSRHRAKKDSARARAAYARRGCRPRASAGGSACTGTVVAIERAGCALRTVQRGGTRAAVAPWAR